MHYGICYPPGWGFLDFDDGPPAEEIRNYTLGNLHLANPETNPWQRGLGTFDAVRSRNAVDIQLNLHETGARFREPECEPSNPVSIDGVEGRWCEDRFDFGGSSRPNPDGEIHQLKIVVPLLQTPLVACNGCTEAEPFPGDLIVAITSRSLRYQGEADFQWQIAKTIRPY
jgi:hypothetical protein